MEKDFHCHRRAGRFREKHSRPAVAEELGLLYVDTGAMYRAITLKPSEQYSLP